MTYNREALSNPLYAEDIINNLEHQLRNAHKLIGEQSIKLENIRIRDENDWNDSYRVMFEGSEKEKDELYDQIDALENKYEAQMLKTQEARLELASALEARDEAVDELNSLVDAIGIVWSAFPEEVLRDQLGEQFEDCDDLFAKYLDFEEE